MCIFQRTCRFWSDRANHPNDLITIIHFSLALTVLEEGGDGCFDGADCDVIENKLIFLTLRYTVLTTILLQVSRKSKWSVTRGNLELLILILIENFHLKRKALSYSMMLLKLEDSHMAHEMIILKSSEASSAWAFMLGIWYMSECMSE